MGFRLITAPDALPVSVAEAKAACRILHDDEDVYLELLIAAAADHVEKFTGRALVEQEWELVLDRFCDTMPITKGPVTDVSSIKYRDVDGVEQTVAEATYVLDDVSDPQAIVKAPTGIWPAVGEGINGVTIRFTCGYVGALPTAIKQAILLMVAQWFANREDTNVGNIVNEMPNGAMALLSNYRSFA